MSRDFRVRIVKVPVPYSVLFPRNANPFQNSFLSIFKHNGMFTYTFIVFSQKLDMGSGFSGMGNHIGSRFLGKEPEIDTP